MKSESSNMSTLKLQKPTDMTEDEALAQLFNSAELRATVTLGRIPSGVDGTSVDVTSTLADLRALTASVRGGDTSRIEGTLAAQANVLDALFHSLVRTALSNSREGYLDAADRYMRLALRAQKQTRTTVEAMAAIRKPSVVFARQANVTSGPQQINNCIGAMTCSDKSVKNELLKDENGKAMEYVASNAAGGSDPSVEAVGRFDRATNRAGEGQVVTQRG